MKRDFSLSCRLLHNGGMSLSKTVNWKVAGAAFALSLGLVACGNNGTNNTGGNTQPGYYPVTINFTGANGAQLFTVAYPGGGTDTFNLKSGAILSLPAGTYTITPPAIGSKTPAAQNITVGPSNPSQTINFAF